MFRIIAALIFASCTAHAEPYAPEDNSGGRKAHTQYSALMGLSAAALNMRPATGLGACMAVGVIKEVKDFYKPSPGTKHGLFSRQDLLADAAGCGLGYLAGNGVRFMITGRGFGVAATF